MIIAPKMPKRVYVEFKDGTRRKKSECVTLQGFTPKQAKALFTRLLREFEEKARHDERRTA